MKSSRTFNNISDKLKSEIPKLKIGQSVVFKMLNGVPNTDPDEKERSKDPVLYPKVQLLTKFRIYDKYQKNDKGEEVGGFTEVGCVDSWNGDQPIAFRCFVTGSNPSNPKAAMPSRFQGKFELRGGNIREEELYEILWLSPQRKGSPCPDESVEVLFEILDSKSDAKASVTKVSILRKALEISNKIGEDKAREVMAALNQPNYQDKDILLAKVQELASSKPDLFIEVYESKQTPLKAIVKNALDANVLEHDFATGAIKIGGVQVHQIKSLMGEDLISEIVNWLETAENGKDVLENIKNKMGKTKEAKLPVA